MRCPPPSLFFIGASPHVRRSSLAPLVLGARRGSPPPLGAPLRTPHRPRRDTPFPPPPPHSHHPPGLWRRAALALRVVTVTTTTAAAAMRYPPPPTPADRPGRRYALPGGTATTLRLALGDITGAPTDAVVNAANEHMLGGRGVDGAIHAAAGPALLAACRALPLLAPDVRVRTGDAVLLPGGTGRLRAAHVIGAVGPVYAGVGAAAAAPLLAAAVRRSLRLAAAEASIRSVALPALSCGVYGYPPAEAADVNMAVLAEESAAGGCLAGGALDEVSYYLYSPALFDTWATAAAAAFGEGAPV